MHQLPMNKRERMKNASKKKNKKKATEETEQIYICIQINLFIIIYDARTPFRAQTPQAKATFLILDFLCFITFKLTLNSRNLYCGILYSAIGSTT